jgi:hypothetical protein
MQADEIVLLVAIGILFFLIIRSIMYRVLARYVEKKIIYSQYHQLLNAPQFRVKGKYE